MSKRKIKKPSILSESPIVMKEIEEDLRFMAWTAWGVGLIFEEKSPKDMFAYMQDPDMSELKNLLHVEKTEIIDYTDRGYILDTLNSVSKLIKDHYEVFAYLNVENQIAYNEEEINARALAYLCGMLFRISNFYKPDSFKKIKEFISIWILPKVPNLSNRIEFHENKDYGSIIDLHKGTKEENVVFDYNSRLFSYRFFLGDPKEVNWKDENSNDPDTKLIVILKLYDAMFNLNLTTDEKMVYLSEYGLTGSKIKKELDIMNAIATEYNSVMRELNRKDNLHKTEIANLEASYQNREKRAFDNVVNNLMETQGLSKEEAEKSALKMFSLEKVPE